MTTEKILRSSREETIMVPHNIRAHFPILFTLFALITLSALAIFTPLVSGASSASAAPARFVLAGAVLEASPTNLTNCKQCMVTIINKNPNRNLLWSAISQGISGVTIKPAFGLLQPKGKDSVDITMPSNITCPANDTITFTGPDELGQHLLELQCDAYCYPCHTDTHSTPTTTPTPSPTPTAIPTQTTTSLTPTATSVPSGGQQNNGNPPTSSDTQGSSVPSILLSIAALLLALLAFTLYLIPRPNASLRNRLLSLILPALVLEKARSESLETPPLAGPTGTKSSN